MRNFLLLLFFGCSLTITSQQKSNFWNNVSFGGAFTLGFGTQTTIEITPSAIYEFQNGFSLGTGLTYI
jgi:hypothetical protein